MEPNFGLNFCVFVTDSPEVTFETLCQICQQLQQPRDLCYAQPGICVRGANPKGEPDATKASKEDPVFTLDPWALHKVFPRDILHHPTCLRTHSRRLISNTVVHCQPF